MDTHDNIWNHSSASASQDPPIEKTYEHPSIDVILILTSITILHIDTNPAFIRQLMSPLKKAGLIASVPGHAMPHLCREPEQITLFEIYEAVEQDKPLLRVGTCPNPECGVGMNIQYTVQDIYDSLNTKVMEELKHMTLKDVIDQFSQWNQTDHRVPMKFISSK